MKINVCCTLFPAGGVENVTTNIRYLTGILFNILIKTSDFFFVKTILGKLRRQITKEKSSKRCRRKSSAVKNWQNSFTMMNYQEEFDFRIELLSIDAIQRQACISIPDISSLFMIIINFDLCPEHFYNILPSNPEHKDAFIQQLTKIYDNIKSSGDCGINPE